jgi:small subunit ribosomal protein S6
MPLYEHVFLARQDVTAQQVEELTEQFKGVIAQNGGEVGKIEYWGVKGLAFRIAKNRKAHYTLMNVTAPPAAIAELERLEKINEDILRVLTVRVDEHETEPSVVMQRRDRDERDRSDRPRRDDSERRDEGGDRGTSGGGDAEVAETAEEEA